MVSHAKLSTQLIDHWWLVKGKKLLEYLNFDFDLCFVDKLRTLVHLWTHPAWNGVYLTNLSVLSYTLLDN